jgi:hypothetical protein
VGEPTRVVARLPATVTVPLAAGDAHAFAVDRDRVRRFDAATGAAHDRTVIDLGRSAGATKATEATEVRT